MTEPTTARGPLTGGLAVLLALAATLAPAPEARAHGGAGGAGTNTVSFPTPTGFRVTVPGGSGFGLPPLTSATDPAGIRVSFGSGNLVVTLPSGTATQTVHLPGGVSLPLPAGSSANQTSSNTVVLNLPSGTSATLPWPRVSPPRVEATGSVTITFPGGGTPTVGLPAGSQVFLPPLSTTSFPTAPTVGLSFGLENQGNTVVTIPGAEVNAGSVPSFQLHPPGTSYGVTFPPPIALPRPGGPATSASDSTIRVVAGKGSGLRLAVPSPITLRPAHDGKTVSATLANETVLRLPKGALGEASAANPAVVRWLRARAPQLLGAR
jgi:hypothetical protein